MLGLADYVLVTWHPDTQPANLDLDSDGATRWLDLEVRLPDVQDVEHTTVEFVAG